MQCDCVNINWNMIYRFITGVKHFVNKDWEFVPGALYSINIVCSQLLEVKNCFHFTNRMENLLWWTDVTWCVYNLFTFYNILWHLNECWCDYTIINLIIYVGFKKKKIVISI